jgi:alpha-ribazole phosphatase/probable phosphoglycerate mutase
MRDSTALRVTIAEELREIDFGCFEGLTYAEIASRYPETYAEWMARPTDVTFPGGENFAAMAARVRHALDTIRLRHCGNTVVVVSHGGVNRIALATALDLASHRIFRLAQSYACINVIDYVGDEPLVRAINLTAAPC